MDLMRQAAALYRQVLASTPDPSFALEREVADVLSEVPDRRVAALELYQQLEQQQPDNASLLVKRLVLENQLGRISGAELRERLLAVLQPLPSEPAAQRELAQALVRLDPPDSELLPIYQQLLASGVEVPFLYFRVAQMQIERNQLQAAREAIAAYRSTAAGASDLTPELLLAEIERRQGNLEASARRYLGIIEANPASTTLSDPASTTLSDPASTTLSDPGNELLTSALRGLAGIRLAQGRPDEALALYDRILQRDPDNLVVQLGRASIAYQTDRISETEAEAVLERWLQSRPATDTPPELFALVGAVPPDPDRMALYSTLLAVDPDNTPVQLRRLQVIAQDDPELARAEVERLIARNPDDISVYFVQGELALALADLELASQAYQEILARDSDNMGALMALAGVRFTQQRYAEARELYEQVLALNPNDIDARRNLAELSAAQDFPFTALEQFQALQVEQETESGRTNPELERRIQRLQVDILKRRGFQPYWERF
jgi:tetratricopeptide (TPR) repeat protein